MKKSFLFIVIIITVFFFRFYQIDKIPAGFYSDESLVGYEAYSILKTGRDQYGNLLPVNFKAFGDYRPGLFIYSTVPFVYLFGLNPMAVRMASVFFSTITAVVVFLLCLELSKNKKIAYFSLLLFAISPWSIQFARMSHDTNLATCLVTLSIYLIIKFCNSNKINYLFWGLIFSGLSFYVYYTPRIFIPLFLLFIGLKYRYKFIANLKNTIIYGIFFVIILIPFFLTLLNSDSGWSRVDAVNIFTDSGITNKTNQLRNEDKIAGVSNSVIFHNKYVDRSINVFSSFMSHFDPKFLFFKGEDNEIYTTPNNGMLMYVEFLLIISGIYYLINHKFAHNKLFLFWLIIGLLPDTLTRFAPAAPRIHLVLPLCIIVEAYGFWSLYLWAKNKKLIGRLVLAIFSIVLIYNFMYFIHSNFVHTKIKYAKQWHYGLDQLINEISIRENNYKKIWVSKKCWGWANFLFFLKYPPQKVQQEIILAPRNEYGLGWVYDIGKYHFDSFGDINESSKEVLYVGAPDEFNINIIPDKIIYYPDSSPAFYIVDGAKMLKN